MQTDNIAMKPLHFALSYYIQTHNAPQAPIKGKEIKKSMSAKTLEQLAESFALFDNWEERYGYLIDLGKNLPPLDEALKTDESLVRGCTSRVWLVAEVREREESEPVLHFTADSDAMIVRGLIHILMVAYQGQPLSAIATIDIEGSFEALGLAAHLSPNRRNGFFAMVETIKAQAALACSGPAAQLP